MLVSGASLNGLKHSRVGVHGLELLEKDRGTEEIDRDMG